MSDITASILTKHMIPDLVRIILSYINYCIRKHLNCPEDTGLYLNDVVLTQDNICDIDRMVSIVIDKVPLPYRQCANLRKVTIIKQQTTEKPLNFHYQTLITDVYLVGEGWYADYNVFTNDNVIIHQNNLPLTRNSTALDPRIFLQQRRDFPMSAIQAWNLGLINQ